MPRNTPQSIVSTPQLPAYRLHKPSGRAVVTLSGRDFYLGRYGSPESRERYDAVTGEWLASGRKLVEEAAPQTTLSVNEVLERYLEHYEKRCVTPDGRADRNPLSPIRRCIKTVRELFGLEPIAAFGPKKLATVRDRLVSDGLCRGSVNKYVGVVRRCFKWAAAEELCAASVWQSLAALEGLRQGRTPAPDHGPVRPVPEVHVDAIRERVSRPVWGLIELQRYTGCRPGEAVLCRAIDIDTTGDVWLWRPPHHKGTWRGHDRVIAVGPQGQRVIKDFLKPDTTGYLFSPVDAMLDFRAKQSAERKTPLKYGNRPGSNRKAKPRRKPRDHYAVCSYGRAVHVACRKVGVPDWAPNQLRHLFATEARKRFGLDAAATALGHAKCDVTQVYAERDLASAVEVALAIG